MITKETIEPFIDAAKSFAEVTSGVATELIAEAINLYILMGLLSVLKFSAVFVIYFIIRKYIKSLPEDMVVIKKTSLSIALCGSILFFTVKSFPHLEEIVKALVAPKIFLIEKGADLIKRGK